jgi:hypothetical protein
MSEDYAVNVLIDELDLAFWFAADLVEFVDHGPGLRITIGDAHYIRDADGTWHETEPE